MEVFLVAFTYVVIFILGIIVGIYFITKPIVEKLDNINLPANSDIDEKEYMTDDGLYYTSKRKVKGDDE